MLRTWQSFAVTPGEFRLHTALKNKLAQQLAAALAVASLKTIRPLTFGRQTKRKMSAAK